MDSAKFRYGLSALNDWSFSEAGVAVVPPEAWCDEGIAADWAGQLSSRRGWTADRLTFVGQAFRLYEERSRTLARQDRFWPPPRRRHLVVVDAAYAVRPWSQLLGTTAWLAYREDTEPLCSEVSVLAWLLALGDRMAVTGEITRAAMQSAAWWLLAADAECRQFAEVAAQSRRPDADALRATAVALPWLRRLRHETLAPVDGGLVPGMDRGAAGVGLAGPDRMNAAVHRPIPGTGLLVPPESEAAPPALVETWGAVASQALADHAAHWSQPATPADVGIACAWLAKAPQVLIVAGTMRIWDPRAPEETARFRELLAEAPGAAVRAIHADLSVMDAHARRFLEAVVEPQLLPRELADVEPRTHGYSHLDAGRRLVAYDLQEAGMERLRFPPLPFGRAMLGARTAHEWGHLAAAAGFVGRLSSEAQCRRTEDTLARMLDDCIAASTALVREQTAADLAMLSRTAPSPGAALARLALARLPDWCANRVARGLMNDVEAEVYARHNVRAIRHEYPSGAGWRLLVRYLYESLFLGQALGFAAVPDPVGYVWASTDLAAELAPGFIDRERFATLRAALEACCSPWQIDPARLRLPVA